MNTQPSGGDLTPISGGATDVAPLGRTEITPAHERTAAEEAGSVPWDAISETPEFKQLLAAKKRFIVPATVFFVGYYLVLPISVGYFRPFMETQVLGAANIAYVFAFSQFIMAWVLAALYVRAAAKWDVMAASIVSKISVC